MIKIAHTSDIQIRSFKRHKEFREHFRSFYSSLQEQNPDIIVLGGDIAHNKTQISPEFVDLCSDFFDKLSDIAPLHIIPGNHDGNLYNLSRMDALSPIIKALNKKSINYYKHSGIYPVTAGNELIYFYVFSCFDEEKEWPIIDNNYKDFIKIGLFHGSIQGAKFQNGQIIEESPYKLQRFLDVTDYLMLGDIHQMQILDLNYRSAYPGSLIQQNYSETVEKGYLLWKINSAKNHEIDFIKLPNVCPFYTIELKDNLTIPKDLKFQKNARVRIMSRPLISSEKKKIQEDVKYFYEPIDIDFAEFSHSTKQSVVLHNGAKLDDLEDENVQEKLFREFFVPYNLTEQTVQKVIDLNKRFSSKAKTEEDIKRNIQYRFRKMSFFNTFSYGEDNVFDFSKYKGIVGIFGKNAVGKSSLVVDIPLYTLFNKISKKGVVKNDLIINENKEDCGSELEIELGNDIHYIRRATHVYLKTGKKAGEPVYQGKTDVDYKIMHNDGIEEDKNGLERADTDKAIKQLFGTAEDSMATSFAPQWQLLGLIDAGGTERQKLVGRYFDIDIFEQKNKLAKEEWKDLKSRLKLYESRNFDKEIEETEKSIKDSQEQVFLFKKKQQDLKTEMDEVYKRIENKEKNIEKFEDKSRSLVYERETLEDKIQSFETKILNLKKYPCVKNEDCCLLSEIQENNKKKEDFQKKLYEVKNKIEENRAKLEEFKKKSELSEDEKTYNLLEMHYGGIHDDLYTLGKKEGSLLTHLSQIKKDKESYIKTRDEYEIFDYFLTATSRDGLSKQIISRNLDIVNKEIKNILSSGVNFEIELISAEEGKAIEVYFKHERSKPRRIELCSGMEKTIAAIAIRAALVNITTLPRSNIFVLDEVFTALDPEYMEAITKMLEYLKQLFDSVIIITHIDNFKDLVDHVVEIERNDEGFSKIAN